MPLIKTYHKNDSFTKEYFLFSFVKYLYDQEKNNVNMFDPNFIIVCLAENKRLKYLSDEDFSIQMDNPYEGFPSKRSSLLDYILWSFYFKTHKSDQNEECLTSFVSSLKLWKCFHDFVLKYPEKVSSKIQMLLLCKYAYSETIHTDLIEKIRQEIKKLTELTHKQPLTKNEKETQIQLEKNLKVVLLNLIQSHWTIQEKQDFFKKLDLSPKECQICMQCLPSVVIEQGLFHSLFHLFKIYGFQSDEVIENYILSGKKSEYDFTKEKEYEIQDGIVLNFTSKMIDRYHLLTDDRKKAITNSIIYQYFLRTPQNFDTCLPIWEILLKHKMLPSSLSFDDFKNFLNESENNYKTSDKKSSRFDYFNDQMHVYIEQQFLKEKLGNELQKIQVLKTHKKNKI